MGGMGKGFCGFCLNRESWCAVAPVAEGSDYDVAVWWLGVVRLGECWSGVRGRGLGMMGRCGVRVRALRDVVRWGDAGAEARGDTEGLRMAQVWCVMGAEVALV